MVSRDFYDRVASDARDMLRGGADLDDAIRFMRDRGFSVVDCIRMLRDSELYSAGEAKRVVCRSAAWADMRGEHEAFHEALVRELEDEDRRC